MAAKVAVTPLSPIVRKSASGSKHQRAVLVCTADFSRIGRVNRIAKQPLRPHQRHRSCASVAHRNPKSATRLRSRRGTPTRRAVRQGVRPPPRESQCWGCVSSWIFNRFCNSLPALARSPARPAPGQARWRHRRGACHCGSPDHVAILQHRRRRICLMSFGNLPIRAVSLCVRWLSIRDPISRSNPYLDRR